MTGPSLPTGPAALVQAAALRAAFPRYAINVIMNRGEKPRRPDWRRRASSGRPRPVGWRRCQGRPVPPRPRPGPSRRGGSAAGTPTRHRKPALTKRSSRIGRALSRPDSVTRPLSGGRAIGDLPSLLWTASRSVRGCLRFCWAVVSVPANLARSAEGSPGRVPSTLRNDRTRRGT
jgi:hypothetical protein